MTQFRVLGPVEVHSEDRVDLGPAKQQVVFAALLMDVGTPVALETLMDRVWGDSPPPQARAALYAYVARIRATLRGLQGNPPAEIHRRNGGYLLAADPAAVDVHQLRLLVRQARDSPDDKHRAELLDEALAQWRGLPLAGLGGRWAGAVRAGLQQERLDAVVLWARTRLALGAAEAVVSAIRPLAEENPLVEPLSEVLVRALGAAGRGPEALAWFDQVRRLLRDELGADPGPVLRDAYRQVLASTASGTRPARQPVPPQRPVPAQLPMDVSGFTGRDDELAQLDALLTPATELSRPAGVVLSAVAGTAGVGKTALAVHWAHRVAGLFPDGQLYVDLRGYGPDPAIEPDEALAGFLRALGLRGEDVPLGLSERAARYRTEVAGRRMLVVLDNASSAEQVRPLLPGSASCAVVVTSRDSLAGLVVRDGARRLDLDLLPLVDAVGLLRGLIGERVVVESGAAARLARLCARLPLALRVAAELAASRPHTALVSLVAELHADQGESSDPDDELLDLERLDGRGDQRSAVRAVFSWSYRHLDVGVARAFRLIGLHPGKDWDLYAAAALAGESPESVRPLLDALARAHLLRPVGPDRYAMHDLLRSYAIWLAAGEGVEERRAAIVRLCDLHLHTAIAAMDLLHPAELRPVALAAHDPVVVLPGLHAGADGLAWLDAERANLVAVSAFALREGQFQVAVDLAATVFRYLDSGGHAPEALQVHTWAREAARTLGQPSSEAHAVKNLAGVHWRRGEYADAEHYVRESVRLARTAGDQETEAVALNNLGVLHRNRGHYVSALEHHRRSVEIFDAAGQATRETRALSELGLCQIQLGRYPEADRNLARALRLSRDSRHRHFESCALDNIALLRLRQGRIGEAAELLEAALLIATEIGTLPDEALFLAHIGAVRVRQGAAGSATQMLDRALALARSTGSRSIQAEALIYRGEAQRAAGRPEAALADAEQALALVTEIGDLELAAPARNSLGETLTAAGRHPEALHLHREALASASRLGSPYEAGRAHLGLADAFECLHRDAEARQQRAMAGQVFARLAVPPPRR